MVRPYHFCYAGSRIAPMRLIRDSLSMMSLRKLAQNSISFHKWRASRTGTDVAKQMTTHHVLDV
jgi:hypothetical protein